jgi:hypothetical protein
MDQWPLRLCHQLVHYQYRYETGVGAYGSQQVHSHGIPEIGLPGIFPDPHCPYKKINENRQHAGCQHIKFLYLEGTIEQPGHQEHCDGV